MHIFKKIETHSRLELLTFNTHNTLWRVNHMETLVNYPHLIVNLYILYSLVYSTFKNILVVSIF